nr:ribonuclease H-like domain-containing protein [Tanacetum cinerariifolium]
SEYEEIDGGYVAFRGDPKGGKITSKGKISTGAYKTGLESVKARLEVYKKNEAVFEEDIKILKLDVMFKDKALTELRKIFVKAKKERDDLKLTLENFENSYKNLSKLLNSQVSDMFKTGVGFYSQLLDSQVNDKYKTGVGYHVVPHPYIGNFMPPKPDLMFVDVDEHVVSESVTSVPAIATSEAKTSESKPKSVSEPLIEDWISDSEDENNIKSKFKQRKPSFAKVEFVKPNEHMTRNMSYLSEYEEIDGGYVAFRGDPKGGKITSKGKISTDTKYVVLSPKFKVLNESQVFLRVPRKNNMYSVDLKIIAPSGGLTFLFAKATLDESNLWHRSLGHIHFKTMNKLVKGNLKEIKREFSIARTPQKNGIAKRKNRTLIEAARTMLADSKLPTTFWAKAVNTTCYVQNMVLVIKPHNKTPYELFLGNQSTGSAGTKACDDVGTSRVETVPNKDYILLPLWTQDLLFSSSLKDSPNTGFKPLSKEEKKGAKDSGNKDCDVQGPEDLRIHQEKDANVNITNNITTVSPPVNAADIKDNAVDENTVYGCADDLNMPNLEEIVYSDDDKDVGAEADMTNLDSNIHVSPILTTRIHKDHSVGQIIRDIHLAPQTRRMTKSVTEHGMFSSVQQRINHKDF